MKISKEKLAYEMARAVCDPFELAEKAGVTYPVIRRAKNGQSIKLSSIGKIARALGVDPKDIMKEE